MIGNGSRLLDPEGRDWAAGRDGLRGTVLLGLLVVVVVFGGLASWSAIAQIDGAVMAPGVVAVESERKSVQHLEGGIVGDILVEEGDLVRAGQPLITLDDTTPSAELGLLDGQICELSARYARLAAERDGTAAVPFPEKLLARAEEQSVADLLKGQTALFETRRARLETEVDLLRERQDQLRSEVDGLGQQAAAVQRQIGLIAEEGRVADGLFAKGLITSQRVNQLSRDLEEKKAEAAALAAAIAGKTGAISETELEVVRLQRGFQEEVAGELREVEAELNALEERLITAEDRQARTRITAPRDGLVMNLEVHNSGQVITPGETVMEIVPADDALVVKARVRPVDIDKVVVGAPALLRLSAFNQRTTPRLQARVTRVSADQIEAGPDQPPYYLAVLEIPAEAIARLEGLELLPGMPAEVFIRTGERRALSFLTKPLTDNLRRAFRED